MEYWVRICGSNSAAIQGSSRQEEQTQQLVMNDHGNNFLGYKMNICFSFLKIMMFVFNGVIFLGGLVLLGIGIWVKVDGDSFEKILGVAAPQMMLLLHVGYLCIVVGSILFILGFLGCWGALKESRGLLLVFFAVILVIFTAEVVCAVVVLIFSTVTNIFVGHLKNWAVKTLKEDYGRQEDLTAIWDTTMKQLKCCGFNNYADFNSSYFYQAHEKYPALCCLSSKECQQSEIDHSKQGCLFEFEMFLNHNGKIVGGVALAVGMVELAAMVVSLSLYFHIGTKV